LFAPQAPGVAILSSGLTPSNPTSHRRQIVELFDAWHMRAAG
jgi:hypothetical protein